jgi:hypothetical protein
MVQPAIGSGVPVETVWEPERGLSVFAHARVSLMAVRTREHRVQVMPTPKQLREIDDWRFMQRMPSRAAALRALLKLGLASQGIITPFASGSQDFSERTFEK